MNQFNNEEKLKTYKIKKNHSLEISVNEALSFENL